MNYGTRHFETSTVLDKSRVGTEREATSASNIYYGCPLKNEIGDNNSFLNCVLHLLYSIEPLRAFFIEDPDIVNEPHLGVFMELKVAISKYQEIMGSSKMSERFKNIDLTELRKEVAKLFLPESKFQIGVLDSPIDLLDCLINCLHSFDLNSTSLRNRLNKQCSSLCQAHKLFWLDFGEVYNCECGEATPLLTASRLQFILEIDIRQILARLSDSLSEGNKNLSTNQDQMHIQAPRKKSRENCLPTQESIDKIPLQAQFEQIYKIIDSSYEISIDNKVNCNSKSCQLNKLRRTRYLFSSKEFMILKLNWTQTEPKLSEILKSILVTPLRISNSTFFNLINSKLKVNYDLQSIICYWDNQYVLFSKFNNEDEKWILYDDNAVIKLGGFREVIIKCLKSHFHPILLLYRQSYKDSSYLIQNSDFLQKNDLEVFQAYADSKDKMSYGIYKSIDINPLKESRIDFEYATDFYKETLRKSLFEIEKVKKRKERKEELDLSSNNSLSSKFNTTTLFNKATEGKGKAQSKEIEKLQEVIDSNENRDLEHVCAAFTKLNDLEEDEWRCEEEDCKNINKGDNATCLRCKSINLNVHDKIYNKRYLIYSDTPKANKNNTEENPIKKNFNPLGDKLYLSCQNCNHSNFYCDIKCDKCEKPIQSGFGQPSKKLQTNQLADNSDICSVNSDLMKSSIGIGSHSKPKFWNCLTCKNINSIRSNFCQKCFKNSTQPCFEVPRDTGDFSFILDANSVMLTEEVFHKDREVVNTTVKKQSNQNFIGLAGLGCKQNYSNCKHYSSSHVLKISNQQIINTI